MTGTWIKRIVLAAFVAAIAAGFVYVLLPDPVPVDVGRADRGPDGTLAPPHRGHRIGRLAPAARAPDPRAPAASQG